VRVNDPTWICDFRDRWPRSRSLFYEKHNRMAGSRLWACASSGDVIALSVFTLSSKLGSVSSSRSASRGRGNDTAGEGKFASFRQNVMQKTKLEDLEVMEMLMGAILRRLRAPRQQ
jgi:hypothetical protein